MNRPSWRCAPKKLAVLGLRLALLASSAIALSGCQGLSGKLATFQKGDGRLEVSLPDVCNGILTRVAPPKVTGKTDAGVAYDGAMDALDEANDRIALGRECNEDTRRLYGGKGKTK
jgi:hypothetical protein